MASKIIILSGNGRGIARIYEMTHKIRLEMDAVVAEKNKRLGVMINDALFTFPYDGRQIAIDLEITNIKKASLIVYSDSKCLLSGTSNGKCDITELMYKIACYDGELERNNSNARISVADNLLDEINKKTVNEENATEDISKIAVENSIVNSMVEESQTTNKNTKIDIENDNKNKSEIACESCAEHKNASKTESTYEAEEATSKTDKEGLIACEIQSIDLGLNAVTETELLMTESIKDKINDSKESVIEKEVTSDNKILSDVAANSEINYNKADLSTTREHEVVTAMLEGKSEMSTESLPLGTVPFYEKIWHKIEEMFDIYQHDSILEDLVYDSAWIRIPYEDDGYYVIGVISDDSKPVFICYGIPQDKMSRPDKEIEDSCEWLPIDKTDVSGRGYWLVYQDAMTGENIS